MGKTRPFTTRHWLMVNRDGHPDENQNNTDAVRRGAEVGELPNGSSDIAGSAVTGRGATISAAGLPRSNTTAGLLQSRAAPGVSRPGIRRTNNRASTAAAGSGPAAAPRTRNGMDPGLLELARPLGVGARPLCRPSLSSRRLGSRPLASARSDLGLGPGALATLGSARGMVAAA